MAVKKSTRDGRNVFTTSDGKWFYVEAKAIAHQNKITDKIIEEIERDPFVEDIPGFGGGGRGAFSARGELDTRGLKPARMSPTTHKGARRQAVMSERAYSTRYGGQYVGTRDKELIERFREDNRPESEADFNSRRGYTSQYGYSSGD